MPTKTAEDALNEIATLIKNLESAKGSATNEPDRLAISQQILSLTTAWRQIDEDRARDSYDTIDADVAALSKIDDDIRVQKEDLEAVATIIHDAAVAVGWAFKIAKYVATA
jgi:hypothetical protein